ncbi:MAG TPA: helix-turn-helix transcriptional regulator [Candidatus Omnitrophota bacterium]|nr:helix-turn-helix transcriptional regulator [Candidatus Omnitrophota bacterium]
MKSRIAAIRAYVKMSQEAFGKRIGISGASISKIESGENNPSEQTIKLICREFNVSYAWLKSGEGPMMVPQEYLQKAKVDNIIDGDNEFVKQIFYGLADMPESWWEQAEEMLRNVLNIKKDR